MKVTSISIAIILLLAAAVAGKPGDRSDLRHLLAIPEDSADAANTRIWLGIERRNSCRVGIEITDGHHRVVRHLFNDLLPAGYYNFYWDKLNDSGQYVPAGKYYYTVNDCGKRKSGKLTAEYRPGENRCLIHKEDRDHPGVIHFDISGDSATASLMAVYDLSGPVDTIATDTVLAGGRHEFHWEPISTRKYTAYRFMIKIDGFVHEEVIHKP
jgi:hypothetical protein